MTMAANPLVSVVIPAYNAVKTLPETLRSVANQTYGNIEILVVDDGSRDGTLGLAREFAALDPRIQVLSQENGGVARARNTGIARASGTYIAPVDADDLWDPRKLELQLEALRRLPDGRGVAYNWYAAIDENGVIFNNSRPAVHEGQVLMPLIAENFIGNGSTPLIPKADLLACGGYDPALRDAGAQGCEDTKLYIALAERLPFVVAPGFLTGYRFTEGNMSSNAARMLKSYAMVMGPVARRNPDLAGVIGRAGFDTARWYYKKAFAARDMEQLKQLTPIMLTRHFSYIPGHWADFALQAAKRRIRRLLKQRHGGGHGGPMGSPGPRAAIGTVFEGAQFLDPPQWSAPLQRREP